MAEKHIYLKTLHLITPELAGRLGVVAEAPVFISPAVHPRTCRRCLKDFTPIMYSKQQDELVVAQHFHENTEDGGGIYMHVCMNSAPPWRDWFPAFDNTDMWVAKLQPIGATVQEGFELRAEAVRVEQIVGHQEGSQSIVVGSYNGGPNEEMIPLEVTQKEVLYEGILAYAENGAFDFLVPVSYDKAATMHPGRLYAKFSTTDTGRIVFSFLDGETGFRRRYGEFFEEKMRELFSEEN